MFENQLGLRENPFVSGHQAKYVYPSREHQEALAHLRYGIENREPFVLITGEVGTGKTTAIYDALTEWGAMAVVALITNSTLDRSELVEEICLRFGVPMVGAVTKPQAMVQLERHLIAIRSRGELAILLIDEAQNLDDGLLEEIRLLSNLELSGEKLLQIFLVGQPELEDKLGRAELRQLKQRIAIHYRLAPLSELETKRYIHHRVSVAGGNAYDLFPPETCQIVHQLTNGIPREINTVASQALLNAFVAESRQVKPEHVAAVAEESEFKSVLEDARFGAHATMAAEGAGQAADASLPMSAPAPQSPPVRSPEPHSVPRPSPVAPHAGAPPSTPPPSALPFSNAASPASPLPPPRVEEMESYTPGPPVPDPNEPKPAAASPPPTPTAPPKPASPAAAPPSPGVPGAGYELPAWLESLAGSNAPEPLTPTPADPMAPPSAPPVAPGPRLSTPTAPLQEQEPTHRPLAEPVLRRPSEATPRPERDSLEWRETVPAQLRDRDIDITTVGDIYRPATPPPAPTTPTLEDSEAAQPVRRRPERIAPHPSHPVEAGVGSGIGEDATQLSPRLRAKLAGSNVERPPKRGLNPMMIAVGSLTVVAVLAFVVFLVGPWSRPKAPSQAPAASQPTVPETTPTATNEVPSAGAPQASAPQPSSPPVASSAPAARPTPGPARSTSPPPSTVATTARTAATTPISSPVKPAAPVRTFGIVVATYINEDRATTEREKLGQSTGLPTRISTAQEDGSEVYRVVVGSFGDRRRAEQAASDLVARGLINEARITSFAR